jgi:ABC-2 type transport system ATP-binding protein
MADLPIIRTQLLTKHFGRPPQTVTAVHELDMEIFPGDIFGFIGPNGAGKTTTIKMLATLLKPTYGEAYVDGHYIWKDTARIRSVIGYMPDAFGTYENMTVEEYLQFFAAAYKVDRPRRPALVDQVLELTDLESKRLASVRQLSRGMQQRLGLARVLIHDPKILLLDEPASGLDPRARIEIRELLKELRNLGKTILISSHILSELEDLCNRVGIIEQGRLVFCGTREELQLRAGVGRAFQVRIHGDPLLAADLIRTLPGVNAVSVVGQTIHFELAQDGPSPADVSSLLARNNFPITYLRDDITLENVFMRLTKGVVA